jgi:hypothetical protein
LLSVNRQPEKGVKEIMPDNVPVNNTKPATPESKPPASTPVSAPASKPPASAPAAAPDAAATAATAAAAEAKAKSLRLVTYGLFVVAILSWVIPFTVLYLLMFFEYMGDRAAAMSSAFLASIVFFVVGCVLCVIAYFIYRKLILKA